MFVDAKPAELLEYLAGSQKGAPTLAGLLCSYLKLPSSRHQVRNPGYLRSELDMQLHQDLAAVALSHTP